MKQKLYYLWLLIYVGVSVILIGLTILSSSRYQSKMEEQAQSLDFQKRILNSDEWMHGNLKISFGVIDIIDNQVPDYSEKINIQKYKKRSFWYLSLFFIASILFIGGTVFIFLKEYNLKKSIVLSLLIFAVFSLIGGLFTPMLEVSAFKTDLTIAFDLKTFHFEKFFPGKVYFYYQSKSIVELIGVLFSSKNIVVAISILIFSVLFPIMKLSLTFISLIKESILENKYFSFIVNKIGKWSMADVFVVAVYLAYLSFNNLDAGVNTESNTLAGLYLFLAYCILSISSTMLLHKREDSIS